MNPSPEKPELVKWLVFDKEKRKRSGKKQDFTREFER